MCGIVYVKRKDNKPAYRAVFKRYRNQQARGTQGFGYVAIKDNKVVSYRRATTEREIMSMLSKEDAPEVLFHHRFPTSVPNLVEAAHPLLVETTELSSQYFIAHNGVIRNYLELRRNHDRLKIPYTTDFVAGYTSQLSGKTYPSDVIWNDSEGLAVETALAIEGKKHSIDTEGSAAVIGLQVKDGVVIRRFFFRNNGNPLKYHEDRAMITLTSVGAGEEVDPLKVMCLKQEGGYEPLGFLFSPSTWRTYVPPRKGVYDPILREWVEQKPVPSLFLPQERKIGFRSHDPDWERDLPLEEAVPYRSITELLGEAKKINNIRSNVLISLSTDTLWEEYDKTLSSEEDLFETIAQVDSLVDSGVSVPSSVLENRNKLQEALDKVKKYQDALSGEITARESFQRKTEDMP